MEAYRGTIDNNLQHLENESVVEINDTLVSVVKEAIEKYSWKRDIKTAKLSKTKNS